MTVRAGTPLADVKAALDEQGQWLPFEPPAFGDSATIGGTIATGLSGPARPYTGAARDYMLGVRMINGQGEHLRFGGEVMKNVAGYDISRVMTGSHGTLGALTEVSLKVLPKPKLVKTLSFEMTAQAAVDQFNTWAGQPLPIMGSAWCDGRAYVRLSGAASAVDAAVVELGGEMADNAIWDEFSELTLSAVQGEGRLWRISVPQTASVDAAALIEWGGAQRWLRSDDAEAVRARATALGGHATLYQARAECFIHWSRDCWPCTSA